MRNERKPPSHGARSMPGLSLRGAGELLIGGKVNRGASRRRTTVEKVR